MSPSLTPHAAPIPIDEHFQRLNRWLDLEAEAEKQQMLDLMQLRSAEQAEASGNTLIHLILREEGSGLGGRILLTLGKRSREGGLPWTRLGVGAPVVLSEEEAEASRNARAEVIAPTGWRGVVSAVGRDTIQVALPHWPEFKAEDPLLRLDRSSDEVARQRQAAALQRAKSASEGRLALLRDILLFRQAAEFEHPQDFEVLDPNLNPSQVEAVRFALAANDLAIIYGPPGTGKTTTVVELIRQLARRGEKVLACAPSNIAVDNLLERLVAAGEKVIRLGHPARVLPELREHTLDLLVENHPEVRLAHKLAREAFALRRQAGKYTRAKPEPGARQAMREEARQMLAEARKIEDQMVERLLDGAQIVCATNTGLDRELLSGRFFDCCVMDEASQGTEPGAWIPLLRSGRLVLAGDHCQLPPTVVSTQAAVEGFNISLMERLMQGYGDSISRQLTVQYRMHQDIMAFSSHEFYEDSLTPHPSVEGHLLSDLPEIRATELTSTPVHFIDTAGASYDEALEPEGESRLNPLEAELALRKVQDLLEAGLPPADLAVIAPYSAQVRLLRERLLRQPEIEVDSVDGFQGREKEAVILSLVRSNRDGEIGFLADVRRMNVALTRARRKLIVIGDSATITSHPFYQRLVAYLDQIGAYHSVWEEG